MYAAQDSGTFFYKKNNSCHFTHTSPQQIETKNVMHRSFSFYKEFPQ